MITGTVRSNGMYRVEFEDGDMSERAYNAYCNSDITFYINKYAEFPQYYTHDMGYTLIGNISDVENYLEALAEDIN